MKKFIKLSLILSLSLFVLVGCSSKNQAKKISSSSSVEDATEESNKHIISTVMGDIEVPKNPERIIVNWYIGDVFTLDLNVVGHHAWEQETMPFFEKFSASKKIENWEPEELMSLNPDLIVTYSEEDFERFNKIAPVLVIPEVGIDSIERIKVLGEATGKSAEAEAAVKVFEEKLAQSKLILDADKFAGKTFSILEDWGATGEWSGLYYETGSRGGTLVYKYLGLKYPNKLQELIDSTGEGRGSISYEVAHEYFGDYILWFRQEGKESDYAKTEIWNSIPAVINENIVEIPGEYAGLFFYSDVTSLTSQLDYMVNAINSLGD